MIHFLPDSFAADAATPYEEAVARLASIRTALLIAQPHALGELPALPSPDAWPSASAARRRRFDRRSIETAQAAAAGLEMLAAQHAAGSEANPHSVARLSETLKSELADLNQLFSL